MTDQIVSQEEHLAALGKYEYGWADADAAGSIAQRGLSEAVVRNISAWTVVRWGTGKSAPIAKRRDRERLSSRSHLKHVQENLLRVKA
jgi:hypothetical protein